MLQNNKLLHHLKSRKLTSNKCTSSPRSWFINFSQTHNKVCDYNTKHLITYTGETSVTLALKGIDLSMIVTKQEEKNRPKKKKVHVSHHHTEPFSRAFSFCLFCFLASSSKKTVGIRLPCALNVSNFGLS